ncbi:MAG: tRNA (adenosine(37)-N6)-threonylcarbamoyltransferase complex ATPase subunit type 1 TsaE [Clostridia bacterium]
MYHFDIYRLEDIDEFYAIGGEDYFNDGICIIEWGEMLEPILPKGYIKITFEKNDELDERKLIIKK